MSLHAASAVEPGTLGGKADEGVADMPPGDRRPAQRPPAPRPTAAVSAAAAARRRKAARQACSFDRKLALFSLFFVSHWKGRGSSG